MNKSKTLKQCEKDDYFWFKEQTISDNNIRKVEKLNDYKKFKKSNISDIVFGIMIIVIPFLIINKFVFKHPEITQDSIKTSIVILIVLAIVGLNIIIKSIYSRYAYLDNALSGKIINNAIDEMQNLII